MIALAYILAAVCAYLLGGVNFGIIITKIIAHKDIRTMGSGNAGSTNVLRVLGVKPALITLFVDFAKALVAVGFAILWVKLLFPQGYDEGLMTTVKCTAALGCIWGHMYPIYFGFKGGKGVITLAGSLALIHPIMLAIALGVFILTVAITKYVSLGSILSCFVYFVIITVLVLVRDSSDVYAWVEIALTVVCTGWVIFKHSGNIKRLLTHTENKLSFKKTPIITAETADNDTASEDMQKKDKEE